MAENQQVVWRWEGEAFGSTPAIEDAGVVVNLRFPGQYFDQETGWFYNWNRYYDPRIGRYITSDPIGLYGGGNTYSYVAMNPNRYYDLMGLKWYPPSIPQGFADFSAGIGDNLLLGFGDDLRNLAGIDGGIDTCSGFYTAGEWAAYAGGAAGLGKLVLGAVRKLATKGADEATGFLGSKRLQLKNADFQKVRNSPTNINGRDFSGHALDQMQNRGFTPTVVENAIQTGTRVAGNTSGTSVFVDSVNKIRVVTNEAGRVVTVIPGIK